MNQLEPFNNPQNGRRRFGLALGGGGARGLAHIGVLKELEKAGMRPDCIAGTSMGGLIGALYASGMSPEEIESVALEFGKMRRLWKLADRSLPRRGVFQGEQLHAFFRQFLLDLEFAGLPIQLTLVAVDLNRGQEVHICAGSVADAVRATVSVPGLLDPVESGDQRLVDGGVLNQVPVDVARRMGGEVVLAVDVFTRTEFGHWQTMGHRAFRLGPLGELIAVLGETQELVIGQQIELRLRLDPPDFLIRPTIPPEVTTVTGYNRAAELIALGEEAAQPVVAELQRALGEK